MQLTQEQRELVCKAYEIATDITEYAERMRFETSFIIDEDLWIKVTITKGPNPASYTNSRYKFLECSPADLDAFRADFLIGLEEKVVAAAQERLADAKKSRAALTQGGEAEDNE